MLIIFAAGQHGPGDASQFVGDCDHYFVTWCPLGKPVHLPPETSGVILDAKQYGPSSVDQHATQIDVAALADAEQLLLAFGGVLAGHDANPGCEVPPTAKGSPVADCGHGCRQRAFSLLMRSISSVIVWTSISTCFHSCHKRSSSQRRRGLRFCSASSITPGRLLRRWMGFAAKVMPRSSKNPRISLISAVRRCTSRSRTRCMACTSSCSSVLSCAKRMFCLVTASAIASASMKSFLFDLRYGWTNWAGMSRTWCPCSRNLAPMKCAPAQASRPISDEDRFAV